MTYIAVCVLASCRLLSSSLCRSLSLCLIALVCIACVLNESIRLDGPLTSLSAPFRSSSLPVVRAYLSINSPQEWAHGHTDGHTDGRQVYELGDGWMDGRMDGGWLNKRATERIRDAFLHHALPHCCCACVCGRWTNQRPFHPSYPTCSLGATSSSLPACLPACWVHECMRAYLSLSCTACVLFLPPYSPQ